METKAGNRQRCFQSFEIISKAVITSILEKAKSIKDCVLEEDAVGYFLVLRKSIEDGIHLLVGFELLHFNAIYSLKQRSILHKEITHGRESPHNSDIHLDGFL